MGLNLKSLFLVNITLLLMAVLMFFGCASIQSPRGGPRDRTPPKLLLATPLNQTRNFKAQSIRLDFDEYFKLTNEFQEITVSPAMEKSPEFKRKQKSLVIDFKDSLQKNTTYVINFGKAIADVNEGNVLKNFTYVFSTGPHIDSLNVSGTVTNTQTQEKEKDATVMLIPLQMDSVIFGKKKPSIYTTTDSAGNFTLANLHDGNYRIYALKEQSANKIYDKDDELIAFTKNPIHLTKDTSAIKLALFKQSPDKFKVLDRHFDPDGKFFMLFNKPLADPSLKINYPVGIDDQKIVEFSKTRDTALLYLKNLAFDSISVSIIDKGQVLETVSRTKSTRESFQRIFNLTYNINQDQKLRPNADLNITANFPIESLDASRIILLEDSVNRTGFTITKDAANPKKFVLKYRWKQLAKYELDFNEGSFITIYGDKNKRLVKKFTIDNPENYGSVALRVNVPDSAKSYVVELLNEQRQVVKTDVITKTSVVSYNNFIAGKYRVRVTYDTNKNGHWDSGNVKNKLYPEQIYIVPVLLTIRPNWVDDGNSIDIPKEVITP